MSLMEEKVHALIKTVHESIDFYEGIEKNQGIEIFRGIINRRFLNEWGNLAEAHNSLKNGQLNDEEELVAFVDTMESSAEKQNIIAQCSLGIIYQFSKYGLDPEEDLASYEQTFNLLLNIFLRDVTKTEEILASSKEICERINESLMENGKTLLHLAAEKGYDDICELLLAYGADPSQKDERSHFPFGIPKTKASLSLKQFVSPFTYRNTHFFNTIFRQSEEISALLKKRKISKLWICSPYQNPHDYLDMRIAVEMAVKATSRQLSYAFKEGFNTEFLKLIQERDLSCDYGIEKVEDFLLLSAEEKKYFISLEEIVASHLRGKQESQNEIDRLKELIMQLQPDEIADSSLLEIELSDHLSAQSRKTMLELGRLYHITSINYVSIVIPDIDPFTREEMDILCRSSSWSPPNLCVWSDKKGWAIRYTLMEDHLQYNLSQATLSQCLKHASSPSPTVYPNYALCILLLRNGADPEDFQLKDILWKRLETPYDSGFSCKEEEDLPQPISSLGSTTYAINSSIDSFHVDAPLGAPLVSSISALHINQFNFNSNPGGHIMLSKQPSRALAQASSSSSSSSALEPRNAAAPFSSMFDFLKWYADVEISSDKHIIAQQFEHHMLTLFAQKPSPNWIKDITLLVTATKNVDEYLSLLGKYIEFIQNSPLIEKHHLQGLTSLLYIGCRYPLEPQLQVQVLNVLKQQDIFTNRFSSNPEDNLAVLEVWSRLLESLWVNNIKLDAPLKETLRKNLEQYETIFKKFSDSRGSHRVNWVRQLLLQMEDTGEHPAKQAAREFALALWDTGNAAVKVFVVGNAAGSFANVVSAGQHFVSTAIILGSWAKDIYDTEDWLTYVYEQRAKLLNLTMQAIDTNNSERLDAYIQKLYVEDLLQLSPEGQACLIYELLYVVNQVMPMFKEESYKIIHKSYFKLLTNLLNIAKMDGAIQVEICSVLVQFSKIIGNPSGIREALRFIWDSHEGVIKARFNPSLQDALSILFGWLDMQQYAPEALAEEKKTMEKNQLLIIDVLQKKHELLQKEIATANPMNRLRKLIKGSHHEYELEQLLTCLFVMRVLTREDGLVRQEIDKVLAIIASCHAEKKKLGEDYQDLCQRAKHAASFRLSTYGRQNGAMELTQVAWLSFSSEHKRTLGFSDANLAPVHTTASEGRYLFGTVNRALIGVMRENEMAFGIRTTEEAEAVKVLFGQEFLQQEFTARREGRVAERQVSSAPSSISLAQKTDSLFIELYTKNGLTIVRDEVAMYACDKFMKLVQSEFATATPDENDPSIVLIPAKTSSSSSSKLPLPSLSPPKSPVTEAPWSSYFTREPEKAEVSEKAELMEGIAGIDCDQPKPNEFRITIKYNSLKLSAETIAELQQLLKGEDGEKADSYIAGSSKLAQGKIMRLSFTDRDSADILISELESVIIRAQNLRPSAEEHVLSQ